MKAAEIRGMSEQELDYRLDELKTEWRDLRFDQAVGKQIDSNRIRAIKRDIARIKTIRTERELAAELELLLGQ